MDTSGLNNQPAVLEKVQSASPRKIENLPPLKSRLIKHEGGAWHDEASGLVARKQLIGGLPSIQTRDHAATGVTAIKERLGVASASRLRQVAQNELELMKFDASKSNGLSLLR